MLGRTSIRALSVLDVCADYGQKRALEKTRAQIQAVEAAILQRLEAAPASAYDSRPAADIQPLLQDREKLSQRLSWLQLNTESIAYYRASRKEPTAKGDPIFETRMAAYGYTIALEYEGGSDTYDALLAEGALPEPPHVVLYPEPNYPAGQGTIVAGAAAKWAKPIGSLAVPPGSAITLFSELDFWGDWHMIASNVPNLYSCSRLNLPFGQPVGSFMIYSLCNLPYTGGWVIRLEPGGYLSARQSEVLRVSPSAGPWETFRFDVVELLGHERARVRLAVDNVTPSPEFVPDAVRSGGMYVMTEERSRGYRRFTLADAAGRPVVLENSMLRTGSPEQEPVLMTRAIKVAKNESEVGMLQLGEAALYEYANYWGRVWVVHETHSDFPVVAGLNDSVSSIRLGPYTGVTLYDLKKLGAGLSPEAERLDAELQRMRGELRSLMAEPDWLSKFPDKYKDLHAQTVAVQAEVMALSQKRPAPGVQQDITENVPDLAETLSGANTTINLDNAASSIRLWRMFPPEEVNIEFTCKLSQDYRLKPDGTLEEIFAYRTTLKFDQGIEEVTIGATDATTIEIAGSAYTVDEDQSAKFPLAMNKQLVIISEARDICTPALKIHTSAMPEDAQAVIYPDREVHQRLANLEPDALWQAEVREDGSALPSTAEPARKPLIDRTKFNKDQIANAQKAIQTAMSSIAYAEPGADEVLASSRFVSARAARDAAWLLDFGQAPQVTWAAAGPVEGAQQHRPDWATAAAPAEIHRVNYQPLNDQQLDWVLRDTLAGSLQQGFLGWLKSGPKSVGDFVWNKIIVTPVQYIWDHAQDFGKEVVDGLKEFGAAAWGSIKDFGDKLVAFLVSAAGEVAGFVLDTVEKVVAVVKTVIEKISAFIGDAVDAIKKLIEYLAFLFNWGDILHTQKVLMEMFNDLMAEGQSWVRRNKHRVESKLQRAADDFKQQLFPSQSRLTRDMEGDRIRLPDAVQETIKVVSEVQEKIDWVMDKIFNMVPSPQLQLFSVSAADRAMLRSTVFSGTDELVNLVGSVAGGMADIFADGISPQRMLAGIVKLLEKLLDAVLDGAIGFVTSLFDVAEFLLKVLSKALNHEWYIPVLSEIYRLLTKQELSLLSATTLVVAIPLTVMTKITIGKKPFATQKPCIALPDLPDETPEIRARSVSPSAAQRIAAAAQADHRAVAARGSYRIAEDRELQFVLAATGGVTDTFTFMLSAVLDPVPPDKELKGETAALTEVAETFSLLFSWISFATSVPSNPFVDVFHEHDDMDTDVRVAHGFKWGIEMVSLVMDTAAALRSGRIARRSEVGFWAIGSLLGIGHLTAVSCICAMDDNMSDKEKAAECLMSIPGPLALVRNKWLAKNKYVWAGCATLLVLGNAGGAAGSMMSALN